MFIGHFAVALAAKKVSPKTSLGTLILAAQLPDLLWPVFLLIGLEHAAIAPGATAVTPLAFLDYPFSHSLLADVGWGLVLAGGYAILRKNFRGACWLWLLVISHWVLDVISHQPDMPIWPGGGTLVGLGLWNSRAGTLAVEITMFAIGLAIYSSVTRPRDKTGAVALASFAAFLMIIYLANFFGPPPPNIRAVAIAGLGIWLLMAWGFWIDRHRASVRPAAPANDMGFQP
jgi:LexA-binding, inner membrane-associated putative hydrolase